MPEGVTGTNMILCYLFGALTLGIWPLVNYARMITLQKETEKAGCALAVSGAGSVCFLGEAVDEIQLIDTEGNYAQQKHQKEVTPWPDRTADKTAK